MFPAMITNDLFENRMRKEFKILEHLPYIPTCTGWDVRTRVMLYAPTPTENGGGIIIYSNAPANVTRGLIG